MTKNNNSQNALISRSLLYYVSVSIKAGEYLGSHPFTYCSKSNEIKGFQTKGRIALWIFNILICLANLGYILFRFVEIRNSEEATEFQKVYVTIWALLYTSPLCNHLAFYLRPDLPSYANTYMKFVKYSLKFQCQSSGAGQVTRPFLMRLCKYLIAANVCGHSILCPITVVMSLMLPNSPEFLSSLVSFDDKSFLLNDPRSIVWLYKVAIRIVSSFVVAVVMYNLSTTSLFLMGAGFPSLFGVHVVITELRSIKLCFLKLLTNKWDRLQVYNMIKILNLQAGWVFGVTFIYAKVMLIGISIYVLYGAIKMTGVLALAMGYMVILSTILLVIIFVPLGEFFNRTRNLIEYWKIESSVSPSGHDKLYYYQLQSMQPLKFYIGNMYYCDKAMLLTMFSFILETLVDLLMIGFLWQELRGKQ